MKHYFYSLSLAVAFLPSIVFGAPVSRPTDLSSLVGIITDLIGILVIFLFALTFLVFVWGIIKGWIINGGEAEGIQEGKHLLVVGIIVFVIMFTIWGILRLLQSSFFGV